ncbi:hypothetical protein TL16_g08713 [Triparma laevis f. inornata]|uniref:Anoctamin transmembrane domain-containing protein n=1 Tax=Triparma laevis f. inornata TaxID=1714386 RepID=A0A9W7B755_9STRA|nr:hypothetical protein TL16_g08713 [Triparma laevis f. inornata]
MTPFGLSIRRATKYFWWWLLFISPFVAWFVGAVTDDPAKGAFGGLWSGLIIVVDFAWTNYTQKGNKPTMRKSPVVLYDDEETARREKAKAKKAKEKVKKEKAKEKTKKLTGSAKIYAEEQQKKKDDDEEENKEEEVYDPEKDAFRPNPRPVADCSNTGNKIYLNSWIAEISLVHPTGGVITKFKDKESSLKRMKVREVKLQKRGAENAGSKEERKLIAAKQRMGAKTKRLSESVKPENANDVIAAFVIFNCEESRNRCLEDYSETGNWFFRYFQAKKLNLVKNGVSYKLRVESAPTPDLIFWENLQLDDLERFARGVFTAIVTTALLFISFALIYVTNLYATAASDALPETTLCLSIIPTIVQGNRSFDEGIKYVHNKTLSESVCGAGGAYIALEGYDYDHLHPFHVDFKETPESEKVKQVVERSEVKGFFEEILAGNHSEQEVFEYKLCDSVCLNASATENDMCGSLGCQLNVYENGVRTGVNNESEVFHDYECNTYSATMLQACYCQQRMDEMVAVKGIGAWSEMKDPDGEGPLCAEFADNFFNAQILAMAGALFIVVINLVLKEIARALVKVEKHPNASSASRALVMKITAAQFLNTAMIGLLMNAQLNQSHKDFFGYEGTPFEKYGLLDGNYQDFYREWFATVGTSLCLTMLANIVVPHVGPFAKGIFARTAKIMVLRKHAATKVEMDELYAMDRFEIETRYGALLNYLMVSVLYAAGMPLLFLFASFNFFIAFWLDKYALLRLNKQPLKYNSALAQMMSRYLIPLAVVLHLSFTCYIYSTPAVTELPSTTGISVVSGLIFDLPEKGKDLKTGELVSSVLVSSPLNGMARDIVEQMAGSHFVLDDLLPRVVRSNVFPIMVLMGAFLGLYIIVSIFGDVLMAFAKLVLMEVILKAADVGKNVAGKVGEQAAKARDEAKKAAEAAADVGKMAGKIVIDKAAEAGKMATGVDGREIAARGMEGLNEARNRALSLTDKVSGIMEEKVPFEMPKLTMAAIKNSAQPDFTAIYEPMMTAMQARHYRKHGRLNDHDHDMGFRGTEDLKCHCIWTEDCVSEDGVQHKSGHKKKTWEVIRGMGIHNYNIEENKLYDLAVSFMIESNIHVENEHRNIAGGRQNRMKAVAKAVFKFKGWKSRKSKREKAETAKSIAIGVEKGVEKGVEEKVEEKVEDEHEPNDEDLKDLMEKPMTMELQAM